MKILIVAGFLGAGKTTFIEELIEKTNKEFVLLENEYGNIDVDSDILRTQEGLNIWELTEGCICCSMKADMTATILTIANTLDPEYLIVEPTGVALLSNLLQNINKILYDKIELLSPIGIIDAHDYSTIIDHQDFLENIVCNANTLLLSKGQDLTESELMRIERKWNQLNPDNEKILLPYYNLEKEWFLSLLQTPKEKIIFGDFDKLEMIFSMETFSVSDIYFPSLQEFTTLGSILIRGTFGKIYRVKGYCDIAGIWTKIDIVGRQFSLEKIRKMEESKLVIIGEGLNREELQIYIDSITDKG